MLIFLSNPLLIKYLPWINMIIFNYSSIASGCYTKDYSELMTLFMNRNVVQLMNNGEFDREYMNFLLSNPNAFNMLIDVMSRVKNGEVVILLVERDSYRDEFMESLIKFIQQRYGYNPWIMDELDDLEYIHEISFSPRGLLALDQDIDNLLMQQSYNHQITTGDLL